MAQSDPVVMKMLSAVFDLMIIHNVKVGEMKHMLEGMQQKKQKETETERQLQQWEERRKFKLNLKLQVGNTMFTAGILRTKCKK